MKGLYLLGSVILFISLAWLMFPHALHGETLSFLSDHYIGEGEEPGMESGFEFHHFLDILLGLNGILLALILMLVSNRQELVHTALSKQHIGY